jgi:hypothetical protein
LDDADRPKSESWIEKWKKISASNSAAAQTDRHDERKSMMAAIRVDAIDTGPKLPDRA